MIKRFFIHLDADAFFASVEQCLHRELRNKPIVTGRDGSIAVAMSYHAKALGIERATPIHEIREKFPQVQMVASDYFMYTIFSNRMVSIIQEYLPYIKRRSVDECCAEITREVTSYEEAKSLALRIKTSLETKLGCTFSIGISSSPLLAKMASGMNKPSGLTLIDPETTSDYREVPIKQVSGLGNKLCYRLSKLGIVRIRDFIEKYSLIKKNFSVAIDDIYNQLQGFPSMRLAQDKPQQSMNRARSFKASCRKEEVFGQLILNYEHLMRKMRNQNLTCCRIYISLRNFDRTSVTGNRALVKHTRDDVTIRKHINLLYDSLWREGESYRYVSLTFSGLRVSSVIQMDLFESPEIELGHEKIFRVIDTLDAKFGKSVISLGSTLTLPKKLGSHIDQKRYPITLQHSLLPGESIHKRIQYPFLGTI